MHQFIKQIYEKANPLSKKTVFLDRDGTINKKVGYLSSSDQISFLPTITESVRKLNDKNFVVIVITNQPVVAKGLATEKDVKSINNTLVSMLNKEHAYINAIYSCPHHPHADMKEYRVACECRKPKLAMFNQATKDFNIDLGNSYIIGDTTRDIMAGKNLGIPTFLVGTGDEKNDKIFPIVPDYKCKKFSDAADIIINS